MREARRLDDAGLSLRQIAARLDVDKSTIYRYLHPERVPYYRSLTAAWRAKHPEKIAEYRAQQKRGRQLASGERRVAA